MEVDIQKEKGKKKGKKKAPFFFKVVLRLFFKLPFFVNSTRCDLKEKRWSTQE